MLEILLVNKDPFFAFIRSLFRLCPLVLTIYTQLYQRCND